MFLPPRPLSNERKCPYYDLWPAGWISMVINNSACFFFFKGGNISSSPLPTLSKQLNNYHFGSLGRRVPYNRETRLRRRREREQWRSCLSTTFTKVNINVLLSVCMRIWMSLFSNIIAFYYDDYCFGGHFFVERPYRCKWRERWPGKSQVCGHLHVAEPGKGGDEQQLWS